MDITGLCSICGKPASKSCVLCGRITCPFCMEKGVCNMCMQGKR
ncbi:orotate phosphoribosyltransferase [Candidatus Micrarchaeota archaeon]|nr:orotate phosphoribosyltransferase [Candidatus Micrarchaeota archaeon]